MEIFTTLYERHKAMSKQDQITKQPIKVNEKELREYHLFLLSEGLESQNKFWGRELIVDND
jgi:hypothetical protein